MLHCLVTKHSHLIRTEAAGSIRAPAACNGLFGLRPSWGSADMQGIHHLAWCVFFVRKRSGFLQVFYYVRMK